MAGDTIRTLQVWGDTVTPARCRDPQCGKAITYATSIKTGRQMPFTGELVALETATDSKTGRPVWTVDLAGSHFVTCPGAAMFRRAR